MKKWVNFTMMVALILTFVACGGQKEEVKKVGEKPQEVKKVEKKKAEAPAAKNELTFSASDLDGSAFKLTHIEAMVHKMQTEGKQYSALIIQLANYDRGGGSYHPEPKEDGQIRLTLNFSTPAGQDLIVGKYKVHGTMGSEYYLSIGIAGKVAGAMKSIGLYNAEGGGEITAIDDKQVSGTVDLKDSKGTSIKASFTAPISKSPY